MGARALLPVLASAGAVVAADQCTKLWALRRLGVRRVIVLPGGWLDLRRVSNPGAAFSVGSGATWVFTLCAAAAVAVVAWLAARPGSRSWSRGQAIALGLLLGGAAANLADRLFRAPGPGVGRVVDFIDYHGWFIGNVADIAIVASAGVLFMRAMTAPGRGRRIQAGHSDPAGHL
jgi:signal peptidase II